MPVFGTVNLQPHTTTIAGLGLLVLFVLGMLGLVLLTDWAVIREHLSRIGIAELLALLGLSLLNYLARALRWRLYTRALALPTGFTQDLRHYLGGFALTITPGRVGELIRLRWISLETGAPLTQVAPLALVDRAADLASVALLLMLATLLGTAGLAGAVPAGLVAAIVAVLATHPRLTVWGITLAWRITGRWPRLFATLRRAARRLRAFSRPAIVLPALALGALGWFAESFAFYLLLGWLGADIGLWGAVAIFLFSMLGGGATGLPGGLGGAEAAMVALLSLKGVPLLVSLPATAIIRLTTLWFAILIGITVFPFAQRSARKAR